MKITDIQVDSFGHWKGLELPDLSAQVTVIHGPNEAGKSTLLHLIRAVLYGFSYPQHARFVPPRHAGNVGGRLRVSSISGRFQVRRWLEIRGPLTEDNAGDLSVESNDGAMRGKHLLPTLLSGIDDAIFRNVFAVGLTEMQQLGTLSDTEAAHQLYGLAAGTDRVSVTEVARQLEQARDQQMTASGAFSIESLLNERQSLRRDLANDASLTPRWLELMEEAQQVDLELERVTRNQQQFGEHLTSEETRQQILANWKECRALHRRYKSLGPIPQIPVATVKRLSQLAKQIRKQRQTWERLRDERRQLRRQAHDLSKQTTLLHYSDQINELHQRAAAARHLAEQVDKLRARAEELEFELQAELERLGLKVAWRADSLPLITDELITELRQPAADAKAARERAEAAERQADEAKREADKFQRQLASTLERINQPDLTTALKRLDRQMAAIRQRLQLQSRLEAEQREHREAREENYEWTERQVLPWRGIMMMGIAFSLGAILLLCSMFGTFFNLNEDQRWTLGVLGVAFSIGTLGLKWMIEFAAGRSADTARSQMKSSQEAIDRIQRECLDLDRQLPESSEPLTLQLQALEDEWHDLDSLQPLEHQRLDAERRAHGAMAEKDQALAEQKQAKQRWRETLGQHGLPEALTPVQFRQIAKPDSTLGQLRIKLLEAHRECEEKKAEFTEITQRVEHLFERSHLVPESEEIEQQIEQLHHALQEGRDQHQQHQHFFRRWKERGRDQEKLARSAKRLQQRRQQLIARHGVVDVQELKSTIKRRAIAIKLQRQRDELLEQIAALLGPCGSLAMLKKELQRGNLETRLQGWKKEITENHKSLAELHQRRGELTQELKHLSGQRSHQQKRLHLDELESQLALRFESWQALAATSHVLETVRKAYESERQPETLAEASSFMKRMTRGKYQRIWTPFGESALCVDNQAGQPVRVEHLSRGTREQVFLSLRLALVASYSRRGVSLPLILDDVFVNFDAVRAEQAAETICEFAAAGHQVLVFTCHDHIRDMFHRLQVDLRILPDALETAENPQPVLPAPPLELSPSTAEIAETFSPEEVEDESEVVVHDVGLPEDNDPELDYELMYGAPEYDPGFGHEPPATKSPPATHERRPAKRRSQSRKRRSRRASAPPTEELPPGPFLPDFSLMEDLLPIAGDSNDFRERSIAIQEVEYETADA